MKFELRRDSFRKIFEVNFFMDISGILETVGSFAGGIIIAGIIAVLVLGLTLTAILFVMKNSVIGAVILWLASFVGGMVGLTVPITFWTALFTGIFGVPAALAIIAYYNLF